MAFYFHFLVATDASDQRACFRNVIRHIESSGLVDGDVDFRVLLPSKGPVQALGLAVCFAHFCNVYSLCQLRVPPLEINHVSRTIHISDMALSDRRLVSFSTFCLQLFNYHSYMVGMNPQQVINSALAVGASSIGASEAAKSFREQLEAMVTVRTSLTEQEQEFLTRERPLLRFTNTCGHSGDHALMAAAREVIRHDHQVSFNAVNTSLETLVLGASARELNLYDRNSHVSFQFALCEGKDLGRTIESILVDLRGRRSKQKNKNKNKNKNIDQDVTRSHVFGDVERVFQEWSVTRALPDRYLFGNDASLLLPFDFDSSKTHVGKKFDVLLAEDVGYNFDEDRWCEIFRYTGAVACYGYMVLPYELVFDNVADNPFYKVKVGNGLFGEETMSLAFHGYQAGYVHSRDSWGTLMNNTVLRGHGLTISVELISRAGPMCSFKLSRCDNKEKVVRCLTLPRHLQVVNILDLEECYDPKKHKLVSFVYFRVRESYFQQTINYCLDLAKDSLKFENVLLYVRRRCSGVSLVTKQLDAAWNIPEDRVKCFSLVCFVYSVYLCNMYGDIANANLDNTFWDRLSKLMGYVLSPVVFPFLAVLKLFATERVFDKLVLGCEKEIWQEDHIRNSALKRVVDSFSDRKGFVGKIGRKFKTVEPRMVFDIDGEDGVDVEQPLKAVAPECGMCVNLKGKLGDQIVTCQGSVTSYHTFSLNSDELKALKTSLEDCENDPVGLKDVKTKALSKMPVAAFEHRCKVHYICGPPGTGKSYAIRMLAGPGSLVVAPYSKLAADYSSFIVDGQKRGLPFKTQHSAFLALNYPVLFVDEFTAFPYEYLAVICYNAGVEEVYLVGDHKQPGVRIGDEGIPISMKIELDKIDTHVLKKNYRNPMDCVCVLNQLYGYDMVTEKLEKGFVFDNIKNFSKYPEHTVMCFSHATALSLGLDPHKVSVRACQGSTFDDVVLVVTEADANLINMDSMAIVALSRHRRQCVILCDESTVAVSFAGRLQSVDFVPPKSFSDNDWLFSGNVSLPPEHNDCLLQAFSEVYGTSKEVIWDAYSKAVGEEASRTVYNQPMSTVDLDIICDCFGVRVTVRISDGTVITCGKSGNFIGVIQLDLFSSGGGHFTPSVRLEADSSVNPLVNSAHPIVGRFSRHTGSPVPLVSSRVDGSLPASCVTGVELTCACGVGLCVNCGNFNKYVNMFEFPNNDRGRSIGFYSRGSEDYHYGSVSYSALNWQGFLDEIITMCNLHPLLFDHCLVQRYGKDCKMPFHADSHPCYPKSNPVLTINLVGGARFGVQCNIGTRFMDLHEGDWFIMPMNFQYTHKHAVDKTDFGRVSLTFRSTNVIKALMPAPRVLVPSTRPSLGGSGLLGVSPNLDSTDAPTRSGGLLDAYLERGSSSSEIEEEVPLVRHGRFSRAVPRYTGAGLVTVEGSRAGLMSTKGCGLVVERHPRVRFSPGFEDMSGKIVAPVGNEVVSVSDSLFNSFEKLRNCKSSFDSFRLLIDDFCTEFECDIDFTNQSASWFLEDDFGSGMLDSTVFDGVNPRRHVKRKIERYYSFLRVAPGNYYFKNSLSMGLRCLQARYLTKVYSTVFGVDSEKFSREIAEVFIDEHMEKEVPVLTEGELNSILGESAAAMLRKNYEKQVNSDIYGERGVSFSMKDIFKPFKTSVDLWKAGQGISAWSKDQQSFFQHCFRVVNFLFIKCLRRHVVFDNLLTEFEVVTKVAEVFDMTPSVAVNGVIDATACDSGQNRFTQKIERRILEHLGMEGWVLDLYYSLRESYTLVGYGVKANIKDIKTSGEPATLLNNTILMAALMNYILVGEGPVALVIKGDDGLKRQANLKYRPGVIEKLSKHLKLEFKVDINVPITFCGYLLCGDELLPDLQRKVIKVLGHHFRDYPHFQEYQISLRDWILNVNKVGVERVVNLSAVAYGRSLEYTYGLLEGLESLTHLNEVQFYKIVKLVKVNLDDVPVVEDKWKGRPAWTVSDLITH